MDQELIPVLPPWIAINNYVFCHSVTNFANEIMFRQCKEDNFRNFTELYYNRRTVRLSTSTVAKIKIRIFKKFSGSNFISGHNDSKSAKKNFDPARPGPARPGPAKRSLTLNNSETT